MKKIYCILFLVFILIEVHSNNINNYQFINIKNIEIGNKEGEIGFLKKIIGGMPRGPLTFVISKYEHIYIPDFANSRINVYDLNLNYLYSFKEKKHVIIKHAIKFFIDEDKNIVAHTPLSGLTKINQNGEILLYFDNNNLPNNFNSYNYFVIDNNIVFYDDNEFVKCITADGKIKNSEETLTTLEVIEKNKTNYLKLGIQENTKKVLKDIKNQKKYIIVGDKYYNSSFYKIKDFFEKTKRYYEAKKAIVSNEKSDQNLNKIEIDDKILLESTFLDYDAEHNSYWRSYDDTPKKQKEFIFIYSNYGEIIDAFYFEDLKDKNVLMGDFIKIAIAPSGDVYFMRNDETGSYFWKVVRRW
ncbi:MAG: hypothetical protein JXB88_08855 [Spirochaetales bacterium]|nr:hypothetical protein [Spirochaetales bacterium]